MTTINTPDWINAPLETYDSDQMRTFCYVLNMGEHRRSWLSYLSRRYPETYLWHTKVTIIPIHLMKKDHLINAITLLATRAFWDAKAEYEALDEQYEWQAYPEDMPGSVWDDASRKMLTLEHAYQKIIALCQEIEKREITLDETIKVRAQDAITWYQNEYEY